MSSVSLNFGQAVEALKAGKIVYRRGWNGKGMFLVLLQPNEQAEESILLGHFYPTDYWSIAGEPHEMTIDPVIAMRTAQGTLQPGWLASQADILAEDWCVRDESADCTAN